LEDGSKLKLGEEGRPVIMSKVQIELGISFMDLGGRERMVGGNVYYSWTLRLMKERKGGKH